MNKICTDINQSKKLIELGIDVNTADMYWWSTSLRYYIEAMDDGDFNEAEGHVPAWSLTALLKLMSKSTISTPNPFCDIYCCRNIEFDMEFYAGNPVDAAFEMVCWLLENKVNYIPVDYKNNK